MGFNGFLIKDKAKEAGYTLSRLSHELSVSRQTISGWISGVVPRGSHLVRLCSILNIKPGVLLDESSENLISVPLHRVIRNKQVSSVMRDVSRNLAEQYLNLLRQAPTVSFLPVIRIKQRNYENAVVIAEALREISGIASDHPMDYKSAFKLLSKMGVYTVFREFPDELKKSSYAYYCRIAGQRVIFVNIDMNLLDMIFCLLHETVHAVRDEDPDAIDVDEEEKFCDLVAELTQFPDYYVNNVSDYITDTKNYGTIINRLKEISKRNNHSLFGIYYRLKHCGKMPQGVNVGGAAANLGTSVPVLRNILFARDEPIYFVNILYELSPNFMKLVETQVPDCSVRKLGEWLGLNNTMDAQAVMDEIVRRKVKQ
ncbi:MAG: XRE family transcriptional regulator [Fibrobacter sp.]|nr:XRE family transcriptional regulator [Fibrobacter sp.]